MILLVSGATRTIRSLARSAFLGVLLVPKNGNAPISPLPWAIDNGAFSGLDVKAFRGLLAKHRHRAEEALWVAVPDVVGNHGATLAAFREWAPEISSLGYRLAFVAQNGLVIDEVPWGEIDCLFIGGDDAFKLGARSLIAEAKKRGKWVHVGRVNSFGRIRWAFDAGADSFDGSSASKFPDTWVPAFLKYLDGLNRQQRILFNR